MIRVKRPELSNSAPQRVKGRRGPSHKRLKDRLRTRQEGLDRALAKAANSKERQKIIKTRWDKFREDDRNHPDSAFRQLAQMRRGKCAYCEYGEADEIDHYLPKSSFPEKMFDWENMLPACGSCNKTYKGDKIEWIDESGQRNSKWIDPSNSADDPLLFFAFSVDTTASSLANPLGQINVRPTVSDVQRARAAYTISELALASRSVLVDRRAEVINHFYVLCASLTNKKEDEESGASTVRENFIAFLSQKTSCLGPIRQILRDKPDLRNELIASMDELKEELAAWDLDPNS